MIRTVSDKGRTSWTVVGLLGVLALVPATGSANAGSAKQIVQVKVRELASSTSAPSAKTSGARRRTRRPGLLSGRVFSGYPGPGTKRRLTGMSVALYSAKRDSVVAVAHATTNRWGRFQMRYQRPTRLGVYYLLARGKEGTGPGRALTLMTVLGTRERVPVRKTIAINELTTVAAVYSLNQFLHGLKVYGPRPGLTNAAGLVENLADLSVGAYGETVLNAPNGLDNATLATLGTLSNLLATCARGTPANCAALFAAATPAGGRTPTNTLAAIHDIAQNPTHNVVPLFNLAGTLGRPVATPEELQQVLIDELLDSPLIVPKLPGRRGGQPPVSPSGLAPYRPALTTPPQAFFLALAYAAPGIDSIGNFGIDALGRVWMSNNMQPPGSDEGHVLPVIDTNGDPVLRSPYRGGGLNLPAFGIYRARQPRLGNQRRKAAVWRHRQRVQPRRSTALADHGLPSGQAQGPSGTRV